SSDLFLPVSNGRATGGVQMPKHRVVEQYVGRSLPTEKWATAPRLKACRSHGQPIRDRRGKRPGLSKGIGCGWIKIVLPDQIVRTEDTPYRRWIRIPELFVG